MKVDWIGIMWLSGRAELRCWKVESLKKCFVWVEVGTLDSLHGIDVMLGSSLNIFIGANG